MTRDHLLHVSTWLVLKTLPWGVAVRLLQRVARAHVLPPFSDTAEARGSHLRLRGGTCLSRAMTTASRLPGSAVSIGVRNEAGRIHAHAWVTIAGAPLVEASPSGTVITSVDLASDTR